MNKCPKKWWEVAVTNDEKDLFRLLARDPKFDWRSVDTVMSTLGWNLEKLQNVANPYIQNRMIVTKKSKDKILFAYWERVIDQIENKDTVEKTENMTTVNSNSI